MVSSINRVDWRTSPRCLMSSSTASPMMPAL
ncbi:Uncharacterised protein [Bordetella pertussis]|nr:Uncharacterised protein [Bordetella pertussis]